MRNFGAIGFFSLIAAFGVWLATNAAIETTGVLTQVHDHEIGPDTVGVRLIGMTQFRVLATGDRRWGRNRTGELYQLRVSLTADEEFSSASGQSTTGISNVTNPEHDVLTYVSIDLADVVTWGRSSTWSDDEVWVNMDRDDVLRLRVSAQDLDCTGENICNRVSNGFYEILFQLPDLPEVLPDSCRFATTYFWGEQESGWGFGGTNVADERTDHRPVLRPETGGALCFTAPIIEE